MTLLWWWCFFFLPAESNISQHICLRRWTVSLCVFSSSGELLSVTFNYILSFETKERCRSLDYIARLTRTNKNTACITRTHPLAILERTSIDSAQGHVSAPSHRHRCDVLSVWERSPSSLLLHAAGGFSPVSETLNLSQSKWFMSSSVRRFTANFTSDVLTRHNWLYQWHISVPACQGKVHNRDTTNALFANIKYLLQLLMQVHGKRMIIRGTGCCMFDFQCFLCSLLTLKSAILLKQPCVWAHCLSINKWTCH